LSIQVASASMVATAQRQNMPETSCMHLISPSETARRGGVSGYHGPAANHGASLCRGGAFWRSGGDVIRIRPRSHPHTINSPRLACDNIYAAVARFFCSSFTRLALLTRLCAYKSKKTLPADIAAAPRITSNYTKKAAIATHSRYYSHGVSLFDRQSCKP
jgi:hypothetical protein